MKHLSIHILKHSKILRFIAFTLVLAAAFMAFGNNKANALTSSVTFVPQNVLNQIESYDAPTINTQPGPQQGQGDCYWPQTPTKDPSQQNLYAQSEWPWIYNQPSGSADDASTPGSAYTVTGGQSMTFNIYTLTFLCHYAVNNVYVNPNAPPAASFSGNGNDPADGTVATAFGGNTGCLIDWTGAKCTGFLSTSTKYLYGTPQVGSCTLNGSSCGSDTGSFGAIGTAGSGGTASDDNPQITPFTNQTRWWTPSNGSTTFSYTAPTTPGSYYIGITVPTYGVNYFDESNGNQLWDCIGGGSIPQAQYNAGNINAINPNTGQTYCKAAPTTYYIYVNVQSPWDNEPIIAPYAGNPNVTQACPAPSNTSEGNINRGATLSLFGGMCNTGTYASSSTAVELYPSTGAGDVGCPTGASCQTGAAPYSGDADLTASGYNGDCMTNGASATPACLSDNGVEHYWWIRANPPPEPDAWSIAQYDPVEFDILDTSNPGDSVCFTDTVTPSNSGNAGATGGQLCYTVNVPMQCTVSSPGQVGPGQNFTVTINVTPIVGAQLSNIASYKAKVTINGTVYSVTLDSSGQGSVTVNNTSNAVAGYGPNNINGSFNSGSSYIGTASCGNTVTVAGEPYFRVYGGDVLDGVDSSEMTSCFDGGSTAGIYSFNDNYSNNTDNVGLGAGTTTAALDAGGTSGQLGFTSGQGYLGTTVLGMLDPLTFSNLPASGSAPDYGGGFNTTVEKCSGPDYYTQVKGLTNVKKCPSVINTTYLSGQGIPVDNPTNTATLGAGDSYICYSPSTVEIDTNIAYSITGASPGNLPIFEVVADGGDINILNNASSGGNAVTQLAGTYIDEGGAICDNYHSVAPIGCSVDEPANTANAQNTSSPQNQLIINGTFIANQLKLYRSYGTIGDDTTPTTTPPDGTDAEEFDYSPINWLAPGADNEPVQSVTGLPPIY